MDWYLIFPLFLHLDAQIVTLFHLGGGGVNLPPEVAVGCSLAQRCLQEGALQLEHVVVKGEYVDRKRWLMSLTPLPAVKRHPGTLLDGGVNPRLVFTLCHHMLASETIVPRVGPDGGADQV